MAVPTDGLIVHYEMDKSNGQTLVDSVGGYDATIYGSTEQAWLDEREVPQTALKFNGTTDRVRALAVPNLRVFSLSFWITYDEIFETGAFPSSFQYLFHADGGSTGPYKIVWALATTTDKLPGLNGYPPGSYADTSAGVSLSSGVATPIIVGQRYHIVLSLDLINGNGEYYVDGVMTNSVSGVDSSAAYLPTGPYNVDFANRYAAANGPVYFNGTLDDVRFYDRKIDGKEVRDLYKEHSYFNTLPTDAIAHYTMDNIVGTTLKDETGSYDMTMVGDPATEIGLIDSALRFDGTDEHAYTSNPLPLMSAFSVSCWVKYMGDTNKHQTILVDSDTTSFGLKFWPNGRVYFFDGVTAYFGSTSSDTNGHLLEIATWTHLLLRSTGSTVELYVNGVLFSSVTLAYSFEATNLATGRAHSGGGGIIERSNLALDQLRIYNRALTQSEIDALYTEVSLFIGLQAHYTMDNISGTTLFDETGNYDGVINGATQVEGYLGEALSFNGFSQYVSLGGISSDNATYSLWFDGQWNAVDIGGILYKGLSSSPSEREFGLHAGVDGHIHASVANGITSFVATSLSPMVPNEWVHIVVVKEALQLTLYVGSIFQESIIATGTLTTSLEPLEIGRFSITSTEGRYLEGMIDQLRIYDRALNQTEIDALYYEEILTKILAGTITETLGVTNWHVRTYRIDNGILTGTIDTTDGTFSIDVGFENGVPHMITVSPDQGTPWARNTSLIINQLRYPTNPSDTPYYYKVTVNGTTGATEPAWPTVPGQTVVSGTVTFECVERMVQPITHSPLIPV